jgi:hypothetical protein
VTTQRFCSDRDKSITKIDVLVYAHTMAEWFSKLLSHRRAISRLVLLCAVIFVGLRIWPSVPHETDIVFDLGPQHKKIIELRIDYFYEGEAHCGTIRHYPSGAPPEVRHRVDLPFGTYRVAIEARQQNGRTKTFVRSLRVPSDTVERINAKQ